MWKPVNNLPIMLLFLEWNALNIISLKGRVRSGQSMNTYITVWNLAVVHLFLPQLEQQIPVLLIERSRVREKSSGQKNIPH